MACGYNSSLPEVAGNGAIYFNADDASDISEKIEKYYFLKFERKFKRKC